MDTEDNQATIRFLLTQSAKHKEAIGELTRLMAAQAIRQAEQYERTQEQFRRTDEKCARRMSGSTSSSARSG